MITDRVETAYARIAEVDRPEIWVALRPKDELLVEAAAVDARLTSGESLPLAGMLLAVKDNIDVAGLPTTAGCPAYAYQPAASAPCVQRLVSAGALILGKTNLDQFATGLVGTRSPFGAVRDAWRPEYVSGGSSSGSAVAVALGITDAALGTDTAGSGRVPAAFGGIVGLKPSYGLVPTRGVVPACRELDCVSVFARTVEVAELVATTMTGPDTKDPTSRAWPADRPFAAGPRARLAVPSDDALTSLSPDALRAWRDACRAWRELGADLIEVDVSDLLQAGSLLYGGAFIASRYAAVGGFIEHHPDDVNPSVRELITGAATRSAAQWVADTEQLQTLGLTAARIFADFDALLMPTVSHQPTIAEVAQDPIGMNAPLGEYTTFCNLLDLAAVAIPAGGADRGQFGISVIVPAFADRVAADLARRFLGERPLVAPSAGVPLMVVGAHLSGMPLNAELTNRGARLIGQARTAPVYRIYALDTDPPKPGLQRVSTGGASVLGELWDIPPAALGDFLAALPAPMALGHVELDDGSRPVGFMCEAVAVEGAVDITSYGGWRAYRDSS
jgi:allophanate hydrolase